MTERELVNKPLYLLDLGGVDWSGVFVYGRPDANKKFNNTSGMNMFYSKLGDRLTSATRKTYDPINSRLTFEKYVKMEDSDIENIKNEEKRERAKNIKSIMIHLLKITYKNTYMKSYTE